MKLLRTALVLAAMMPSLLAQEPLTLHQAIDRALHANPAITVSNAAEQESAARIGQARAAYFPSVEYSESFQRSDNPVFVFTSLLTQREFGEQDFASIVLNRSRTLNNFQTQLTVEQVLFDGRQTSRRMEAARLEYRLAQEDTRQSQADVVLKVLQSYFAVVLADKNVEVARDAVESAEADLSHAESIYASGRTTQADVLGVRVYLAAMREQQIRAMNQVDVARTALNDAMGVGMDCTFELTTPLQPAPVAPGTSLEESSSLGVENRAEMRQAKLNQRLAHKRYQIEGAEYWPQVVAQASVEADRQEFSREGAASWFAGVTLHWSLWNGGKTRARVTQARFAEARADGLRRQSESAIRLEIRKAYGEVQASAQRVEVASAAFTEAEEAQRITKNRHESGLTTITELLRSEAALTAARTRYLAAIYDYRVAAAVLAHATGVLTADSTQVN